MKNMKSVLSTVVFLMSTNVFAVPNKPILSCSYRSNYIKASFTIKVDLNKLDPDQIEIQDDRYVVSWSQTECEDMTTIEFDKDEFRDLLEGKVNSVTAHLKQAEPDADLAADVLCTR